MVEAVGLCWSEGSWAWQRTPLPVSVSWGCHSRAHRTVDVDNRHLLSQSSGVWKSEMGVWAGLVPSEGCRGMVHSRLPSLACRWPSSGSCGILSVCVSKSPPSIGTPVKLG